jgi:hypothetical protein
MQREELVARLEGIERTLTAIDAIVAGRAAPPHISQALADIEQSYGLIGQLAEVAHAQREQVESLIGRIDRLLAMLEAHDARLVAFSAVFGEEREDLRGLLVQLRELARRQVRSQEDLVRMVGDGGMWDGQDRRGGVDRRS